MRTKTRVEKHMPDEVLTATVIEGIDNATVALHLELNGGPPAMYPKIMDAGRSFVRVEHRNVSADGDSMDVDAMTKSKGKGKKGTGKGNEKGKSSKNENRDAIDNQWDRKCFYCETEGHSARHCKK